MEFLQNFVSSNSTEIGEMAIGPIPVNKYITAKLCGRLGNLFFIIFSTWAYAKKNNLIFCIKKSHTLTKYSSFFGSIVDEPNNINYKKVYYGVYTEILNIPIDNNAGIREMSTEQRDSLESVNKNICINGFVQNANNFNLYRNELLLTFFNISADNVTVNNNFFIHVRLTDFLLSRLHYINLDNYYAKAIAHVKQVLDFGSTNFVIISDDIENAKKQNFIKLLDSNGVACQITYISNHEYARVGEMLTEQIPAEFEETKFQKNYNEITTLDVFKNCYQGGILSNSTYAWWGAYLITNPNKLVVCPNKFINSNDDFSGLYMDYVVIDV